MAECDLHSVDQVDSGIASWSATENRYECAGDKAHVHQVVLDGFRQIESYQDRAFSDFELAEDTHLPSDSTGPAKGQEPEITTRKVGLQYRTK